MKKIDIYTDGACSGNPGPGGWGCVVLYNGVEKRMSGFEKETTNNRMELLACVKALEILKEACEVNLYSDSAYLINAFENGWIYSWIKNGWRTSSKGDVKNVDLWQQIYDFSKTHKISWIKVKGHADNEYNNICDKLAVDEIKNSKNAISQYVEPYLDLDEFEERTISKELKFEGRVFDVERHVVELPNGEESARDIVVHGGATAVIPIDSDGGIYMVRQYRKPMETICLEIPAGKLDKGEKPIECVTRELREETGFTAGKIEHLFTLWPSPAILTEVIEIFVATDLIPGEQDFDDGEFLHVEKIPIENIKQMIYQGKINDSKTISSIMLVEKYLNGEFKK